MELVRGDRAEASRVFISYRRDDSGGHTGRIRDHLRRRYGPEGVFQDVDTIRAGEDFMRAIAAGLDVCDVQLVVIGPEWLEITGAGGRRRLDEPDDPLVVEIATGLANDHLRVIPVLVGGASMPDPERLPASIQGLVLRNAVEVRDARWDDDLATLVEQIGGRSYRVAGLRRPVWAALAGVALLAMVGWLFWPEAPDVMDGTFRIAVGEFATDDSALDDQAEDLSQTVFRGLTAELGQLNDQGFDFGLRAPNRTGVVRDATEAARLAEEIEADVVVYATLTGDGLEPEFYLHERQRSATDATTHFAGAEELTGQHDLGSRILGSSIATGGLGPSREVVTALASRTNALAQFVIGLSYYVADEPRYELAQEHFQLALDGEGWPETDGKEVLHLFLGNTAVKLVDLDTAQAHYLRAFEVSGGGYARAHLGLAEMTFQNTRGSCEQDVANAAGLERAQAQFELAQSIGGPPVSDIDVKAALGTGRVKRCRSNAGLVDLWDEAEADLRSVIAAFDDGNTRVKALAAVAHAELALIVSPSSADSATAEDGYEAAIEQTQSAIELTTDVGRLAALYNRLGFFHERLGNTSEAEAAYQTAGETGFTGSGARPGSTPTSVGSNSGSTGTGVRDNPPDLFPVVWHIGASPACFERPDGTEECVGGSWAGVTWTTEALCADEFDEERCSRSGAGGNTFGSELTYEECLESSGDQASVGRIVVDAKALCAFYFGDTDPAQYRSEAAVTADDDDPNNSGPGTTTTTSGPGTTTTTSGPGTTTTTSGPGTTTTTSGPGTTTTTSGPGTTTTSSSTTSGPASTTTTTNGSSSSATVQTTTSSTAATSSSASTTAPSERGEEG